MQNINTEQKDRMIKNIKRLRMENGLSQESFADIMGVTRNSVQNYESGKTLPGSMELLSLHNKFDVSFDYLFGKTLSKEIEKDIKDYSSLGLSDDFMNFIKYHHDVLKNKKIKTIEYKTSYELLQLVNNLFNEKNIELLQLIMKLTTMSNKQYPLGFDDNFNFDINNLPRV